MLESLFGFSQSVLLFKQVSQIIINFPIFGPKDQSFLKFFLSFMKVFLLEIKNSKVVGRICIIGEFFSMLLQTLLLQLHPHRGWKKPYPDVAERGIDLLVLWI